MSYLNSEKIKVFPTTRRKKYDQQARLMSENNIASVVYDLIDYAGYIITPYDKYKEAPIFEFDIHGYTFKVQNLDSDGAIGVSAISDMIDKQYPNALSIYALIKIDLLNGSITTEIPYQELFGQDVPINQELTSQESIASEYSGVNFIVNKPTYEQGEEIIENEKKFKVYYLNLLEKRNGEWVAPRNSFYKFNMNSINIDIDGGEIK